MSSGGSTHESKWNYRRILNTWTGPGKIMFQFRAVDRLGWALLKKAQTQFDGETFLSTGALHVAMECCGSIHYWGR